MTPEVAARFWAKVDKAGPVPDYRPELGPCWIWNGSLTRRNRAGQGGYGVVWRNNSSTTAHRVTYELLVGPIPEGFHVDHLCRVRRCVNPDHLEPVSRLENIRRGVPFRTMGAKRHPDAYHPTEAKS